jgi:quinol monooxygenase YgiN
MHILHVQIHIKPEAIDAFREATIENARHTRREPACRRFDLIQELDDPTRFVLVEIYRDAAGHAAHRETAHYKAWADKVAPLFAEARTRAIYRNIDPGDDAY